MGNLFFDEPGVSRGTVKPYNRVTVSPRTPPSPNPEWVTVGTWVRRLLTAPVRFGISTDKIYKIELVESPHGFRVTRSTGASWVCTADYWRPATPTEIQELPHG